MCLLCVWFWCDVRFKYVNCLSVMCIEVSSIQRCWSTKTQGFSFKFLDIYFWTKFCIFYFYFIFFVDKLCENKKHFYRLCCQLKIQSKRIKSIPWVRYNDERIYNIEIFFVSNVVMLPMLNCRYGNVKENKFNFVLV